MDAGSRWPASSPPSNVVGGVVGVDSTRGQTTIDFVIGVAVFIIVVGFVFGVIPNLIDPFSGSQETTLVADRLATQITEGMFAKPDRPTVLNATCTFGFFDQTLGSGKNCAVPYEASETDLSTRLGVNDRHSINVSIRRDVDSDGNLELLSTDGEIVSANAATQLSIGPTVPSGQSVIAASRTAFIDGKDVTVVVKVW